MNNAWALGVLWNFIYRWSAACGCGRLEWLYLPTDCMMSRSIGAAKSGLRWMNMDRATTARQRVSSSYSSRTAAQSRHLQAATGATGHLEQRRRLGYSGTGGAAGRRCVHLSDMVVGCSSMNSSGAGTNMLTVLGADSRLVLVGPAEDARGKGGFWNAWLIACWIRALPEKKEFSLINLRQASDATWLCSKTKL